MKFMNEVQNDSMQHRVQSSESQSQVQRKSQSDVNQSGSQNSSEFEQGDSAGDIPSQQLDQKVHKININHLKNLTNKLESELEEESKQSPHDWIQEGFRFKHLLPGKSEFYKHFVSKLAEGRQKTKQQTTNIGLIKAKQILELMGERYRKQCQPFFEDVNHIKMLLPQYPKIVKKPMSLHRVYKKLTKNNYNDYIEFQEDMSLIINNSYLYNHGHKEMQEITRKFEDAYLKCEDTIFGVVNQHEINYKTGVKDNGQIGGYEYLDPIVEYMRLKDVVGERDPQSEEDSIRREYDSDYERENKSSSRSVSPVSKTGSGKKMVKKEKVKQKKVNKEKQKGYSEKDIREIGKRIQKIQQSDSMPKEEKQKFYAFVQGFRQQRGQSSEIELRKLTFEEIERLKLKISSLENLYLEQIVVESNKKQERPSQSLEKVQRVDVVKREKVKAGPNHDEIGDLYEKLLRKQEKESESYNFDSDS